MKCTEVNIVLLLLFVISLISYFNEATKDPVFLHLITLPSTAQAFRLHWQSQYSRQRFSRFLIHNQRDRNVPDEPIRVLSFTVIGHVPKPWTNPYEQGWYIPSGLIHSGIHPGLQVESFPFQPHGGACTVGWITKSNSGCCSQREEWILEKSWEEEEEKEGERQQQQRQKSVHCSDPQISVFINHLRKRVWELGVSRFLEGHRTWGLLVMNTSC